MNKWRNPTREKWMKSINIGGKIGLIIGRAMGFLDKLSRLLTSSRGSDKAVYWIYVRCNRCNEKLRTRINLYNDLSLDFNSEGETRYLCRKTMVGSQRCFQRIEVILSFDSQRVLTDRSITGGEFIDEDEYFADEG